MQGEGRAGGCVSSSLRASQEGNGDQLMAKWHCPAKAPWVAPLNGTGLGIHLLRKHSNAVETAHLIPPKVLPEYDPKT